MQKCFPKPKAEAKRRNASLPVLNFLSPFLTLSPSSSPSLFSLFDVVLNLRCSHSSLICCFNVYDFWCCPLVIWVYVFVAFESVIQLKALTWKLGRMFKCWCCVIFVTCGLGCVFLSLDRYNIPLIMFLLDIV